MAASVQPPVPDTSDSTIRRIEHLEAIIAAKDDPSGATPDDFAALAVKYEALATTVAAICSKVDSLATKVDIMPTIIMESFGRSLATAMPDLVEIIQKNITAAKDDSPGFSNDIPSHSDAFDIHNPAQVDPPISLITAAKDDSPGNDVIPSHSDAFDIHRPAHEDPPISFITAAKDDLPGSHTDAFDLPGPAPEANATPVTDYTTIASQARDNMTPVSVSLEIDTFAAEFGIPRSSYMELATARDNETPVDNTDYTDLVPLARDNETPDSDFSATTENRMLEPKVANLMPDPWFIPAFIGEARFQLKFAEQCCTNEEKHGNGISPEMIALAAEFEISVQDLMQFDEQSATAGAPCADTYNDYKDLYDYDHINEQASSWGRPGPV